MNRLSGAVSYYKSSLDMNKGIFISLKLNLNLEDLYDWKGYKDSFF